MSYLSCQFYDSCWCKELSRTFLYTIYLILSCFFHLIRSYYYYLRQLGCIVERDLLAYFIVLLYLIYLIQTYFYFALEGKEGHFKIASLIIILIFFVEFWALVQVEVEERTILLYLLLCCKIFDITFF